MYVTQYTEIYNNVNVSRQCLHLIASRDQNANNGIYSAHVKYRAHKK